MTPKELQAHLLHRLPSVPGITTAEPWPERPYGLAITLASSGGCAYWMVTGASGVVPASGKTQHLDAAQLPDLPPGKTSLGLIEQALLALAATADGAVKIDAYSSQPTPPAVGFGGNIDFADGWRLFLSCAGTATAPGSRIRPVSSAAEV